MIFTRERNQGLARDRTHRARTGCRLRAHACGEKVLGRLATQLHATRHPVAHPRRCQPSSVIVYAIIIVVIVCIYDAIAIRTQQMPTGAARRSSFAAPLVKLMDFGLTRLIVRKTVVTFGSKLRTIDDDGTQCVAGSVAPGSEFMLGTNIS